MEYDALNRLTRMVDASGTNTYSYTAGGRLWTEDGPFANDTVTNSYQNRLRTGLALQQGGAGTPVWTNRLVYDAAGRLTNITSQAGSFGYTYTRLASPLVAKLLLPNTAYITNTYDSVGRVTGTWLNNSANTVLDSSTYGYNTGGQRLTFTNEAGTRLAYTYDDIGQLKVADSSVNTEDRGYAYDAAWNLSSRTNNGLLSSFTVDAKNQLVTALGANYTYDASGNLVQVGGSSSLTAYFYDDENRLVVITNGVIGVLPPPQPGSQLAPQISHRRGQTVETSLIHG